MRAEVVTGKLETFHRHNGNSPTARSASSGAVPATLDEVLEGSDVVLAEDTRRAGLLFKRLGIEKHGRLMSFFEHNEDKRLPKVLEFLEDGLDVALISDAGTPLLSDPGFTLVRALGQAGLPWTVVPGPSSTLAARTWPASRRSMMAE